MPVKVIDLKTSLLVIVLLIMVYQVDGSTYLIFKTDGMVTGRGYQNCYHKVILGNGSYPPVSLQSQETGYGDFYGEDELYLRMGSKRGKIRLYEDDSAFPESCNFSLKSFKTCDRPALWLDRTNAKISKGSSDDGLLWSYDVQTAPLLQKIINLNMSNSFYDDQNANLDLEFNGSAQLSTEMSREGESFVLDDVYFGDTRLTRNMLLKNDITYVDEDELEDYQKLKESDSLPCCLWIGSYTPISF